VQLFSWHVAAAAADIVVVCLPVPACCSPWLQPLAEALQLLTSTRQAVLLQLQETWLRPYQVCKEGRSCTAAALPASMRTSVPRPPYTLTPPPGDQATRTAASLHGHPPPARPPLAGLVLASAASSLFWYRYHCHCH
jgi:hypothetical protein